MLVVFIKKLESKIMERMTMKKKKTKLEKGLLKGLKEAISNKNLILVTVRANWADEMDVYSFGIFTEDSWIHHELLAKKIFNKSKEPVEVGIGSNQQMIYDSYEEYKKQYNTTNISKKDSDFILKTFKLKINSFDSKVNFSKQKMYSTFGNWVLMDLEEMEERLFDEDGKELKELRY